MFLSFALSNTLFLSHTHTLFLYWRNTHTSTHTLSLKFIYLSIYIRSTHNPQMLPARTLPISHCLSIIPSFFLSLSLFLTPCLLPISLIFLSSFSLTRFFQMCCWSLRPRLSRGICADFATRQLQTNGDNRKPFPRRSAQCSFSDKEFLTKWPNLKRRRQKSNSSVTKLETVMVGKN